MNSQVYKVSDLKKSTVVFYDRAHTYINEDGVDLSGVTKLMERHGLGADYSYVPKSLLESSSKKGKIIHSQCQVFDEQGFMPINEDAIEYTKLGLKIIASEFLVSDNEHIATQIDKITEDLSIGDIKSTSVIHKEPVRWQLSISAYLFEKQTGLKANKLFVVHLKNRKAKKVYLDRIPDSEVEKLIECDKKGKPYKPEFQKIEAIDNKLQIAVAEVYKIAKETEKAKNELNEKIKLLMEENNIDKIENEYFTASRKSEYTKETFDKDTALLENPSLSKYLIKSIVKSSVLIKVK